MEGLKFDYYILQECCLDFFFLTYDYTHVFLLKIQYLQDCFGMLPQYHGVSQKIPHFPFGIFTKG